jgi:hypothetical protein
MNRKIVIGIVVAAIFVASMFAGCVEEEETPAAYPTPTATPTEATTPTPVITSTPKPEPKYSVGDILKAKGQSPEFAYLILDYDVDTDSYQTTIVQLINDKWVYTGEQKNWRDRDYYEETLGLVIINHIDIADIVTATPEVTSEPSSIYYDDEAVMDLIKTKLSDEGFQDVTTQIADGRDKGGVKVLILSYRSSAASEDILSEETGYIVGAYLGCAAAGWDIDELMVIVGDIAGNAVGTWYCEKEWTDDYINGRIRNEELILNVLGSMTIL